MAENLTTHHFQADVDQVLQLVVNSLYSNKEIFLRELISNASDALDKLRFQALTHPELLSDDPRLRIRLIPDPEAGTLTIWDNGIGMDEQALVQNLGTVAHSGTRAFFEQQKAKKPDDVALIGQFGVGFYSAYLVADRVEVVSRPAGQTQAWRWLSEAHGTFSVGPAEREARGTSVILHLKEEHKPLLSEWQLRQLVTRYSDFVGHPIELQTKRPTSLAVDEEVAVPDVVEWQTINSASALWRRSPAEIAKEQYVDFYKHVSHDWEEPLGWTHFHIEGTTVFTGLLFVPKRRPLDLFDREFHGGLRLYVKRVFIMDQAQELLPQWLRFMRGIIDSDDLPLNISRELLQDSSAVKAIQKAVVKKTLERLEVMARDEPETYASFWESFGAVLKEGLYFESGQAERLARLVRYRSTRGDGWVSLQEYADAMPEGQPAIYYALGQSRSLVASSPHLEAIRRRGWEVLFMTDPVDQWALEGLSTFAGKPLVSAMQADLELDAADDDEKKRRQEADKGTLQELRTAFAEVLADRISEVRISHRLTDSPVCLVVPDGGLPPHIERLLRANQKELPEQKRILEVNPDHPLIAALEAARRSELDRSQLNDWIALLYDQARIAEGSPLEDPARFATALTSLMARAVEASLPPRG